MGGVKWAQMQSHILHAHTQEAARRVEEQMAAHDLAQCKEEILNLCASEYAVEDLVLALDVSARDIQATHEHLLGQMSKMQRADKDKAAWSRKEGEALWGLIATVHAIEVAHAVLLVKWAAHADAETLAAQSPTVQNKTKSQESLSPAANANAVAPTSRQTVQVTLTLDMSMDEIAGKHSEFMQSVEADVAMAVRGDRQKVRVLSLEAGSIIVHLELDEGICVGEDAVGMMLV